MPTIAAIASSDSQFSILLDAVVFIDQQLPGTDLVGTLSNTNASLTVFAPTNSAFGQLAADLGFTGDVTDAGAVVTFLATSVPAETLRDVVLYHVLPSAQTAADLTAANGPVTTALGATIGTQDLPTLVDNEPDLIDPSLVATDIVADNGIVHVIDKVLLPIDLPGNDAPTITGIVASSGTEFDRDPADFDILLKAVVTAGLAETLDNADADLTAFAPTDQAFLNLAAELGFTGSSEGGAWNYLVEALTLLGGGDPVPLLTQILTYHVAGESLQVSEVLSTAQIATLQDGSLTVDAATLNLRDADPDLTDPSLIATDIQAANGVVHVIDNVLIPADLLSGAGPVDFEIGSNRSEFFNVGRGDDFVDGNGGNDFIVGGRGDDTLLGGNGNDAIIGGRDDDTILGGSGNDHIAAGIGHDTIYGGEGNDLIGAGAGTDFVDGGAGRDDIFAGSGADTVLGGSGSDHLRGGRGDDTIEGGTGNDLIGASRGDDNINGGAGRDTIYSGRGDDTVNGGTGNDVVSGGLGRDTFVFEEDFGRDLVRDFRSGQDVIDLTALGFENFSDIEDQISSQGNRTIIELDEGTITLRKVNASSLDADDFLF